MRKELLFTIIIFAIVVTGAVIYMVSINKPDEDEFAETGYLKAMGNRLVDKDNKTVTLRGVSIADPYYLEKYNNHFSEDIFAELSEWNINVIRIPIHPGWWQDREDYSERYLDTIVDWAEKYGFYVIFDWHAIGNPITGVPQNPEWKERGHTVYNSSFTLAESAWIKLAKKYCRNTSVIFELFNEPASVDEEEVDWTLWRNMVTNLIDKIRKYAPQTLILVSGWHWTYDLRGFKWNPIERENIAYVAHVYASHNDSHDWEFFFGFMTESHPVVVTEWGFSTTVDSSIHYHGKREEFGHSFIRYLEEKNMSWMGWCFHPEWQPNMIKNWEFDLTEEGRFMKQVLTPDDTPPSVSITTPADGVTITELLSINGTALDNIGLLQVEIKINDSPFIPTEVIFGPSYQTANWSYFWTNPITEEGSYSITVKVIDTSGNETFVTININISNSHIR
jgi:endoglucanase